MTTQLLTFTIVDPDAGGDLVFEVHEIAGLAAVALVILFWLIIRPGAGARRRGG